MKYILMGLFFLLFDYPLTIPNCSSVFGRPYIDLIPSFVGFGIILKGLVVLTPKSIRFKNLIPWAKVMMIVNMAIWVLNVLGVGDGMIGGGASYLVKPVEFYITYSFIKGIREVEDYYQTDLQSTKLKKAWLRSTISFLVVVLVAATIPIAFVFLIISAGANLAFNIYFFVCMFNTKDLYDLIPPENQNIFYEQNSSNGDEI